MSNRVVKFDKQEVFNIEIQDKLREVMRLCKINKIPAFFTAATYGDEDNTKYYSEIESPDRKSVV